MSKQRFRLTCATDAGEGERYCRGDLVIGFAMRDTPGKDKVITTYRMIGKGRPLRQKDIGNMLDVLRSDPTIDDGMLLEAVDLWLDEQKSKEGAREWIIG